MRSFILACATLALGGCAFEHQPPIPVKPVLVGTKSEVGAGKSVYVEVVDERPSKLLGTRGVKGIGSQLEVADDFPDALRRALADGLRNRGFVPVEARTEDGRELKVEINNLQYEVNAGFWAGTLRVNCALKAICMIGNTRPYEKLHRGEREESVQVVQAADRNVGYVNDAISNAVNDVLGDAELQECLAH